jgi:hypothetical protein
VTSSVSTFFIAYLIFLGAEIEMTVRGDTLVYKNAIGGIGSIRSSVFCRALCDTYYGKDPVSPTHKESVVSGIRKM